MLRGVRVVTDPPISAFALASTNQVGWTAFVILMQLVSLEASGIPIRSDPFPL